MDRSSRRRSSTKKKPVSDSSDDDDGGAISPRVRKAALKSHLRKRSSQEGSDEPLSLSSSSRADRRERRKSRRGSKANAPEGKSVDAVDASALDARQRRREQRRNKRTPKHDASRKSAFGDSTSSTGRGFGSSGLASSGRRSPDPNTEMTEVEVIAWQHRINQRGSDEDSNGNNSDGDGMNILDADDSPTRSTARRHPVAKSGGAAWGARQPVPKDSDSTAGLKSPRVRCLDMCCFCLCTSPAPSVCFLSANVSVNL